MNEKDDVLVKARPLLEIVNTSWDDFLFWDIKESEIELFRKHERNGRPLGNTTFVKQLETILDRRLRPKTPGRRKIGNTTATLQKSRPFRREFIAVNQQKYGDLQPHFL